MSRILLIGKIGSKQNFVGCGLPIPQAPSRFRARDHFALSTGYFRNPALLESPSKMAAGTVFLRTYSKLWTSRRWTSKVWTAAVAACLATLVLAALILPESFRLTALSDMVQCLLLFSGTVSLFPHAVRSRGRLRLFWMLIATGMGFWFAYQFVWIYFEIWLRTDVPDLCAGDMILFLHIVPLMAALALRPHAPEDEYAARLRRLDFALMTVWWIYLYVLIVIPWQYVVPDVPAYNYNLNSLYLIEKLAFLSALVIAWIGSKGGWKTFYANLFGSSFTYAASSHIANWAIGRHTYYSGSLYDIPLAVSMAWITMIGLWCRQHEPQTGVRSTSTSHGVWLARLGMIAAFSLPLFAAWALLDDAVPPRIRSFRVVLTLAAAILMGAMVFVRQRLLDWELLRLLTHSRESFANLKRLQAQITESEKLASIGQLLGGAAHELNNPITAMLGYSDLLLCTPLTSEQSELAGRIRQHARRTRSLVASLLSFAKQGPAAMAAVDLNTLLRTAVKLSQLQWQALKIEVNADYPQELLLVRGDSNQLLQVCVQIISDALQAVGQYGSRTLTIAAERRNDTAIIHISDTNLAASREQTLGNTALDFDSPETLSGLGLNACQVILEQHHGRILWQQDRNVGTTIRVELPVIPPEPEKSTESGVPVMWQPQPFA
jgi:signal transduction histidine kinase